MATLASVNGPEKGMAIFIGPKSKKEVAYEVLKQRILTNEYEPGMPINESSLGQELAISKTPIREALQQLERDGFIETVPGRGSFVTHITVVDIRELFESREILECGAVGRVALVGDRDLILRKKQELESSIKPGQRETGQDAVRDDIHIFIFKLLGNRKLSFIYSQLMDQIVRVRNYFNVRFDAERTALYDQEHMKILEALLEGDPEKADKATRIHLRNATAYLIGLMAP